MDSNVKNKTLVWEYIQQLNRTSGDFSPRASDFLHPGVRWHGPYPINELEGIAGIEDGFWNPISKAIPGLRIQPYILMAGVFKDDEWVSTTGDITGIFADDWLGIPANGKTVSLRYGEFYKIVDGKIAEFRIIIDIPDLMRQAGFDVLRPALAEVGSIPGPKAGDGILLEAQDPGESEKSLKLVEAMIAGLSEYDGSGDLDTMGQERFWTPDMLWYGPHGIGTTYGLKGFQEYHQRPFLEAFPDRKGGNHVCRHADGLYVASTGWPSVRGTHLGQYMGVAPTNKPFGMRVMDWWRRQDDLLHENWVFIDLVDLFLQVGVDLFERMNEEIGKGAEHGRGK